VANTTKALPGAADPGTLFPLDYRAGMEKNRDVAQENQSLIQ
jgi:hypothetical protein